MSKDINFQLSGFATRYEIRGFIIEKRNETLWCIIKDGLVYDNFDSCFIYERLPSNRTDDFIMRTRFSLYDAKEIVFNLINDERFV